MNARTQSTSFVLSLSRHPDWSLDSAGYRQFSQELEVSLRQLVEQHRAQPSTATASERSVREGRADGLSKDLP